METSAHDILIIGGGGAGLRAAIEIAQQNPKLSVAMVSKVYPMRSHTVSAEGGAAGVAAKDDSIDEHCYDTISGSDEHRIELKDIHVNPNPPLSDKDFGLPDVDSSWNLKTEAYGS